MDAHARVGDLGVGSEIPLRLSYTSSTGQLHIFTGTGIINNDSYIDQSQPNHQIRLENVSFPDLPSISNATFVIQPQDEKIYIICNQLTESNGGPIIYITICMNVNDESVYEPIDDRFIGTDIARTADIKNVSGVNDGTNWTSLTIGSDTYGLASGGSSGPVNWSDILNKPTFATVATSGSYADLTNKPTIPTTTSQLTNDSNFITNAALTGYTTEQRVQEMIDASIGTAIGGTY